MTRTAQEALHDHYNELERRWNILDRSADYGRLVVPNGNMDEPIHRWFRLKEAYSAQLLPRLFKDAGWEPAAELSLLDPFVGSGTTLLSALAVAGQSSIQAHVFGVERNPVIRTVAAAKIAGVLGGVDLAAGVREAMPRVFEEYKMRIRGWRSLRTPSVTLNNATYFPPEHVRALLAIRAAVDQVATGDVYLVLQTCLAAAVEPAGRLRRDGRALRYAPERRPIHPLETFRRLVDVCVEDLRDRGPRTADGQAGVLLGDGRSPRDLIGTKTFDWIVFSPPYPNNIDYTEVYKVEAWVLGCYSDVEAMRQQRLATVRSHPSIQFPDVYAYAAAPEATHVDQLIGPLLAAVPADRYHNGRRQIIKGYVDDMLRVLKAARGLITNSGRLTFVVGNSVHGTDDDRFVIAADLLMARLAEIAGWDVEEVRIARWTIRRGGRDHYVRESVVCLAPSPDALDNLRDSP